MDHPNIAFIQRFYELFARGETHTLASMFSQDFLFMPAGKHSQLAGPRRGPEALLCFTEQQMELTGGTWIPRPYDILASEDHIAVLVEVRATRGERTEQFHLVHVWHIQGGRATGLHSYVDDQYLYDEFFA
jgi:ketosteroid isomerase-like protein